MVQWPPARTQPRNSTGEETQAPQMKSMGEILKPLILLLRCSVDQKKKKLLGRRYDSIYLRQDNVSLVMLENQVALEHQKAR